MNTQESKDPLHGLTLERIVTALVDELGWEKLGNYIKIRCFTSNPSIPSSLKFLRKNDWARSKVENLYIAIKAREQRKTAKNFPKAN
jgi:uncharacterized protein (DUF2132 family)